GDLLLGLLRGDLGEEHVVQGLGWDAHLFSPFPFWVTSGAALNYTALIFWLPKWTKRSRALAPVPVIFEMKPTTVRSSAPADTARPRRTTPPTETSWTVSGSPML